MTKYFVRVFTSSVIALGFGSSFAVAQTVPAMPSKLEVGAGHSLFFKAHAVGTQNYVCLPAATPSGVAWRFYAPEATLYQTFFGQFSQQLATHFLSANPDEAGLPRATWQHSIDTSRVWAKMVEQSSDPAFVEAGAIPWFKLSVVGSEAGPEGGSFLRPAVFIQRLNTSGGLAPATGCDQAANVGAIVLVPYEADYFFYKVTRSRW
jgi:uncharacterized protein DUF3455